MDFYVAYSIEDTTLIRGVMPVEKGKRQDLVGLCPEGDTLAKNSVSLTPDPEGWVDLTIITVDDDGKATVA